MLKIRLQRVGRKNDPSFRVVCTDSRRGPKSGNNIEILGSYDPKKDRIAVKGERAKYWISKGAQVSYTVNNIFVKDGVIKGKKIHVSKGKKNTRKPEEKEVKSDVIENVEENKENANKTSVLADPTNANTETEIKTKDVNAEETQSSKKGKEEHADNDVESRDKLREVSKEKEEVK